MLYIKNISKNFGHKDILINTNLTLYKGEIACLIGSNGSGKTTLFKMIQGLDTDFDGKIDFPKQMKTISIQQELPDSSMTLYEYICDSLDSATQLKELQQLEEQIAERPANQDQLLTLYGEKQSLFEKEGGYQIFYDIKKVLEGLDFKESQDFHKPLNYLSGGEIRRALLAKALIQKADMILLDEPTNHLDIKNILFLESFLKQSGSTILFISHDLEFIENTANIIISLYKGKLNRFEGRFSEYQKYINQLKIQNDKKKKNLEAQITQLKPSIQKFQAGTRSQQAQNLQKRVDSLSLEIQELKNQFIFEKGIQFKIKVPHEKPINPVLVIENLELSIEKQILLKNVHWKIFYHECWVLLGKNGSGKTTLIQAMKRAFQKKIKSIQFSRGVELGIYHQEDLNFFKKSTHLTTLEFLYHRFLSQYTELQYHQSLHHFNINPNAQIQTLSGGEKSKLRLLSLFLTPYNFLILDEPTNHMDIPSIQGLVEILKQFKGSLLIITHDRALIRALNPLLAYIHDHQLRYDSQTTLEEILEKIKKKSPIHNEKTSKSKIKTSNIDEIKQQKKIKYLEDEREKTVKKLQKIEAQISEKELLLFLPEYYNDQETYNLLNHKIQELKNQLQELYQHWEKIEADFTKS